MTVGLPTGREDRNQRLMMRMPVAMAHVGMDGRILALNDRFVSIFGYTLDDLPTIQEWWLRAYPDPNDRREAMDSWNTAVRQAARGDVDIATHVRRVTCRNGDVLWIEISGVVLDDAFITTLVDVTERKQGEELQKRANRQLQMIASCNHALLRAGDEQALLDEICRIICEEAGYRMAWVGYAEHDEARTVIPRAWAGHEAGFLSQTGLTWADLPAGHRPLGEAIRSGKPAYVQDFTTASESAPWIGHATQRGYRSAIALPLRGDSGLTLGSLCIYSDQPQAFTADEISLLEELANDLAFGIALLRLRAEQNRTRQKIAASEQLFRTLVEHAPEPIARYNRELQRIYVNPAIRKLFAKPVADVLGATPAQGSPLIDPDGYMAAIKQAFETGEEQRHEGAYRASNGGIGWSSWRFAPEFDADGKVATVLVVSHDISERVGTEDRLRLAASVFSTSQEGILISDPKNRVIDVNPAFTRLTGYTREEVLGKTPHMLSSGRHGADFYAAMWQAIDTKGGWHGEIWNRRKSGEVFAELLSIVAVKDNDGKLQHYVGVFSDISILKEHEADLDRIAHYDVLTGLPNRRLLGDRLEQATARARRLGKTLAVCYLDLDGFKPINDQFGHEGGDRLLVEVSRRLQKLSRSDDTVARLGGDEFVLLWNDIEHESEFLKALDRILVELSAPITLDDVSVSVSASIGVTLYPDDKVDADNLLRHADHAMYSAKQLGKNRYQMFDARLEKQMSSRFEFLDKVSRALDEGRFELYYQPKIDCVAHRLIGVEALMRWNDPILGMIVPKEFLPLIENDNLALRAGRWVVEQAVQQARTWHEMGLEVPISVNIFPRHLKFPTFVDDLRLAIATHWPNMPEKRLLLEILETSELEELDPIESVIKECLAMGIGFSLDDFGTGYSSLVYLRRLSVEELKIDQSFVRDMLVDPDDEAIVAGVIALGKAFDLRVVAEGVESDEQVRHLLAMGCTTIQGHGLGRPMPARELPGWLRKFSSEEMAK